MVPPGQLCVSVCTSACLSYCLAPPPLSVLFLFLFPFFLPISFFPNCPSLCLCLYLPFCFLLSPFPFCFASSPFRFSTFLFLFCFPGVLGNGVSMFVLWLLSLFYTPRVACEPAIYENLRILLCVSFLAYQVLASLLELNFFSLFAFLYLISSISISISIFRFRVVFFILPYFFWVVCGPLGSCGDL